mgnify:CR=1 FL=1
MCKAELEFLFGVASTELDECSSPITLNEVISWKKVLIIDIFYQGTIDFNNDTAFHFHSRG